MRLRTGVSAAIALVGLTAITASAAPAPSEHGATQFKDIPCFASVNGIPTLFTLKSHTVVTPSLHDQTVCHFDTPPQAQTVRANDFPCFTVLAPATDSRLQLNRAGQGLLFCQVKLNRTKGADGQTALTAGTGSSRRTAQTAGSSDHTNNGLHRAQEGAPAGQHGQHVGLRHRVN